VAGRSFRLRHRRLLPSRQRALGKTQDLGRAFGHLAGDDAFLVDQECDGRREDSVLLRHPPAGLQEDGEINCVVGCLTAVLLDTAAPHDHDLEGVPVLLVEPGKVGQQSVTGAAIGIAEHKQDAPAAVVLEGNCAAEQVGEREGRRRRAGRKPFAFDPARSKRFLGPQVTAFSGGFAREPGDLVGSQCKWLRDASLLVEQVGNRGADLCERVHGVALALEQDRAVESMLSRKAAVHVGVAVAHEHELCFALAQIALQCGKLRRNLVTEAAARIPVNEQHPFAPEVLERNEATAEVGKTERGHRRRDGKAGFRAGGAVRARPGDQAALRRNPLERLDAQQEPTLLAHDLEEGPAEADDGDGEEPEKNPPHSTHTRAAPAEVQPNGSSTVAPRVTPVNERAVKLAAVADRDQILAFADEYLDVTSYPDYGPMGLQVAGATEVTKIACGVSASRELFERAAAAAAQMVIVHHGLFWDRDTRVIGPAMRARLEALFAGEITLAAYHLALDAHPEIGNNALLADELGIEREQRFTDWGYGGRLAEPMAVSDFSARVQEKLDRPPLVFSYGPEEIERVAVLTGGAARYVNEAATAGYHCYVTGEADEPTKHAAKEAGIHFIAGGHYATETLGVRALAAKLADEFGLEWEFVDLPNPV
jgi:dinuclear metal center YbgI/SA1388 family protein